MRNSFLALVFLAFGSLLIAQQSLNNDSMIKLTKAGLSDDLIVSTINASPGIYDTSADGLIALKKAGASDKVVSALVLKASSSAPAPRTQSAPLWVASQLPPFQRHTFSQPPPTVRRTSLAFIYHHRARVANGMQHETSRWR